MLSSETILISGASGAIGLAIAKEALECGAQVILGYHQNVDPCSELIQSYPEKGTLLPLDLTSFSTIQNVFEQHSELLSSVAGLVNCSGIHHAGPLISMSEDEIVTQLQLNLGGAIFLTQAVLKSMIRKRRGSIVHLGSVSAHRMTRGHSVYSATKAALEGFCRSLASEVAKRGIRVNCVQPGPVMSKMLAESIELTGDNPASRVPINRLVEASEVAKMVAHLLGPDSRAITGATIPVDGGYLLW